MSVTLRVILIISSFIAFYLCITKIKKSQLKIENSVTWMLGCIILILMSIFPNVVVWISEKLGFVAPVNFIFLVMIAFLLMQIFIDNIHITSLNEKIKDLVDLESVHIQFEARKQFFDESHKTKK